MPTDSCVFCGFVGKLTGEDALPKWIARELLPPDSVFRISLYGGAGGSLELEEEWRSALMGHPTECVCATCNNRWMSTMEQKIKPVILPMFTGTKVSLDKNTQKKIAAWATKTAYMLSYSESLQQPVHADWRQLMYVKREPPPTARVWLATYAGDVMPAQYDTKEVHLQPEHGLITRDWPGNLVTFSIMHLAFQVWIPGTPDRQYPEYRLLPGVEPYIRQIWPVVDRAVTWPTKAAFETQGFKRFSRDPIPGSGAVMA